MNFENGLEIDDYPKVRNINKLSKYIFELDKRDLELRKGPSFSTKCETKTENAPKLGLYICYFTKIGTVGLKIYIFFKRTNDREELCTNCSNVFSTKISLQKRQQ